MQASRATLNLSGNDAGNGEGLPWTQNDQAFALKPNKERKTLWLIVCGVIAQKMTEPENVSDALTQRYVNLPQVLSPCTTSPIQGVSGTNAEKAMSREVLSEAILLNYFDLRRLSEPEYRPLDAGLSNVFCPNI